MIRAGLRAGPPPTTNEGLSRPSFVVFASGRRRWRRSGRTGVEVGHAVLGGSMSEVVANRYLTGPYAPVEQELTAVDLPVTGQLPAELDGRYLRNGPNPLVAVDPVHAPLVRGRRHGARGAPARRPGRVVPQPLGPLHGRVRGAGRGAPAGRALQRHGHRQHQRDRPRRPHVRAGRGRRPAGGAHRRARDHLPHRPRRHPAPRLLRPPQARPRHRRAPRGRLPLGSPRGARVHGDRHRRPGAPPRRRPRARQPDGARLLDHRPLRRALRPPGHLRPRHRHGRARGSPTRGTTPTAPGWA